MTKGLYLGHLKSANEVGQLKIESHHYRGGWLVGFGWDENNWPDRQPPTYHDLDIYFPNTPVLFSRADGHFAWANMRALELSGLRHHPTGILNDAEKMIVDQSLPAYSDQQIQQFLLWGQEVFLKNNFNYVRDMAGEKRQWQALVELEKKGELKIFIEENFVCEKLDQLQETIQLTKMANQEKHTHLRVTGLKIYLDGALGSEGAYLSQPYGGSQSQGFLLWSKEEIKKVLSEVWKNQLTMVVHSIGDAATDLIVEQSLELKKNGIQGRLCIEHAEVIRSETIEKMKELTVTCYMQPCHWLSDRRWLKQKLGDLYTEAFPWKKLVEAGIPIFWGSDSPIEKPSVEDTYQALKLSSSEGIPSYPLEWWQGHVHPDITWK